MLWLHKLNESRGAQSAHRRWILVAGEQSIAWSAFFGVECEEGNEDGVSTE
jgi:hypothetical protein